MPLATVMHDIDEALFVLTPDGSLEVQCSFTSQRRNVVALSPKHVLALRAFFTMPRVAPTLDDAAAVRYASQDADRAAELALECERMNAARP